MIKIIKKSFEEIEKDWNTLYNDNPMISPYMSYQFQKLYKKNLWFSYNRFTMQYQCFCIYKENEIICIIPLIKKQKKYYIAGDLSQAAYLDFIYSKNLSILELDKILNLLYLQINGELNLNKISEFSLLYKLLNKKYKFYDNRICVNIHFNEFDDYHNRLKKSVNQNFRTAINRINREGKTFELNIYNNKKNIDSVTYSKIMKLYHKRSEQKNELQKERIVKFVENNFNPMTLSLKYNTNNFISVLTIDNEIAGFLCGFISSQNHFIVVPRLSINTDYKLYCPGNLLIQLTIKYLTENTDIKNLDLSRGTELYKYNLGGEDHHTYDFMVKK